MGRQILLYMLPKDRDAFLSYVQTRDPVVIIEMVSSRADVGPAKVSRDGQWLCLWNRSLLPHLRRKLIPNAKRESYRVDESQLPVLEFSTSFKTTWGGRPALGQGRLYGIFEGKPPEFERWYGALVRWLRKHYQKNPTGMGGYLGPAAYEFYRRGGYLLPMFVPPRTKEWLREIGKQH